MTSHYLVDAFNNGLTRILKSISNDYPNVDFKEVSEKYLIQNFQKKPKRKGHVSAYNIFVKETRPSIVGDNPNLSFAEIAAQVSKRWGDAKKDKKRMAELEKKKQDYLKVDEPVRVEEPVKPAPVAVDKKVAKKRNKV